MSTTHDLQRKQQWALFAKELIGFTLLFFVLGSVVYFLFHRAIYQNIDYELNLQKTQILTNQKPPKFYAQPNQQPPRSFASRTPVGEGSFRTNVIVFDKKGRIINSAMLGNRIYQLFENTKLVPKTRNRIQELTLTAKDHATHYFRTLLIKVPKRHENPRYSGKYVLIMENIDADLIAMHTFRSALLITLIIFWILAVGIAYFLSRSSMKPILRSWRRQQEFSANAAHELKTPLAVIQSQMEYLLTKPKARIVDQAEPISTSLDEVAHLKTLTDRLLLLARSDAGMIQINRQTVELLPFLTKVIKPYQEVAQSQHKQLIQKLAVSGYGDFDADRIRQLIIILLDNALKYSPANGQITIQAKRLKDKLTVQISDHGPGILDDDKARIFERFYRTDRSRNSKTGGNGLGLAIAKWLVQAHHGSLKVTDNQPHGAIFTIELPLKVKY